MPNVHASVLTKEQQKKKTRALSGGGPSRARIDSGGDIEDMHDALGNHAVTTAFATREEQSTKQLPLKGFTRKPSATGNKAFSHLPGASPMRGSVYLFSLDPVFIGELDESQTRGEKSDDLLSEFQNRVKPLSPEREVTVKEAGKTWQIEDQGARYIVYRENTMLDVYMAIEDRGLSFELEDAPMPQQAETALLGLANENETRVFLWLEEHAREIAAAESKFRVDRRAIAGAIAWEALVNVKSSVATLRAVGPGKVHYWTWRSDKTTTGSLDDKSKLWGEAETAAEQVENAGLMPKTTQRQRKEILKTPAGAIDYIGAIMSAFAAEAEKLRSGGWQGENIRNRPEILTNAYQGEDLNTWRARLDAKKPGDKLQPGNDMAYWVRARLHNFLEPAIGTPEILPLLTLDTTKSAEGLKGREQGMRTLPTLKRGDRSEAVRLLQQQLNRAGLAPLQFLPENGNFGPMTESHVREFQRRRGLKDDGAVGHQTWQALDPIPESIEERRTAPAGVSPATTSTSSTTPQKDMSVVADLQTQIASGQITFDPPADQRKKELLGENSGTQVTERLQKLVLEISKLETIRISSIVRSEGYHGSGQAVDIGNEDIAGTLLPKVATDDKVLEWKIDEIIFDAKVSDKDLDRNKWNYDRGKKHDYATKTLNGHRDHIHFAVKAG